MVLCSYRYKRRIGNSTQRLYSTVMLNVEFSDQIVPAFKRWAEDFVRMWRYNESGECPMDIKLTGYATSNGKQSF